MTEQSKLETGIGTKEAVKLEAKNVKVVNVDIRKVKESMEKAVLVVKHPDAEDPIEISSSKYEKDNKITITGLWYKLDGENKIQKGSALAILLSFYNVQNLKQLIDKELKTVVDEKGYLVVKSY